MNAAATTVAAPEVQPVGLPTPGWQARIESILPDIESVLPNIDPAGLADDIRTALAQIERLRARNVKLSGDLTELRRVARQHLSAGGVELAEHLPHTTRALANAVGGA